VQIARRIRIEIDLQLPGEADHRRSTPAGARSTCRALPEAGPGREVYGDHVEDRSGSTCAGQFESYLGVETEADYLTAVRACWAALWSVRALRYLATRGIDPSQHGDGRARPALRRRASRRGRPQPDADGEPAPHSDPRRRLRDRAGRGGAGSLPVRWRCSDRFAARAGAQRGLLTRATKGSSRPCGVPRSFSGNGAFWPAPPRGGGLRTSHRDRVGPRRRWLPARPGATARA
jgi:hypothetical protein